MAAEREAVTAAEIIRNFGYWQQQALTHPITITHHGRARVLLISTDEYERLQVVPGSTETPNRLISPGQRVHSSLLLENMSEGFLLFDGDLRIVDLNSVAEAFIGQDRAQILGQTLPELGAGVVTTLVTERLRRVQRTGEAQTLETTSVLHPGRTVSVRLFPVGEQIGLLFVNTTEQEQMRDLVSEWQACCDIMRRHTEVTLIRLDGRGRVVSADAQFGDMTGFEVEELAQVKLFDILTPASRRRFTAAFEDMMTNREPISIDARIMVKQGGERGVRVVMAPLVKDFSAYSAVMLMSVVDEKADSPSA